MSTEEVRRCEHCGNVWLVDSRRLGEYARHVKRCKGKSRPTAWRKRKNMPAKAKDKRGHG